MNLSVYLNVPPSSTSPTDLQLAFNFGTNSNSIRGWNILISMIPCDSINLGISLQHLIDAIKRCLMNLLRSFLMCSSTGLPPVFHRSFGNDKIVQLA